MESKTHPGVQEVQVDGLALLQIIKHCNESKGGATADGQLLGLEANGKLEVTNAFPTAENKADYDGEATTHMSETSGCCIFRLDL